MTFGILEPKNIHGHVPGTALLEDVSNNTSHASRLRRTKDGKGTTLLIPQPSNDPNDPLNWPLWQRDFIFIMLCYCTILCAGVIGPVIAPSALLFVVEFDVSFAQVSQLTGYQLCAIGALGVFMSTFTRLYGKRPVFIVSILFCLAGSIWCGLAKSYGSLVGARVLQGAGVSVWESIMYSATGDLYFVHQRGSRMAFFGVCASGLGNLGPLIAGVVAENKGWRWSFFILNIFLGIATIFILFFGWEITYKRDESQFETDTLAKMSTNDIKVEVVQQETMIENNSTLTRKSYIKRLAFFSGRYTEESFLMLLIAPFTICINPAVLWSIVTLSFATAWQVVVALVLSQVFSGPPYLLTTAQVGYIYGGPVVGSVIGAIICGLLSDRIAEFCARRNNGIYEPEFRLFLVVGMAFFMGLGFFLFGNLIEAGTPPVVAAVTWGLSLVGFQFCSTAMGTYMVDGYQAISIEVFIIGMIFKNFLFFGFTFFINDWVAQWGPARMFNCIGGVHLGICALTIPMYILGKRCRYAFRHQAAGSQTEKSSVALTEAGSK